MASNRYQYDGRNPAPDMGAQAMSTKSFVAFLTNWKTTAGAVTGLLVLVGADGRKTSDRLNAHLNAEVPALIQQQRRVDAQQDSVLDAVDGLALAECLRQREPIARAALSCGDRERRAGIPRR